MDKRQITITVAGECATGKSTIIDLIQNILENAEFDVTVVDSDITDVAYEHRMLRKIEMFSRLKVLKAKTKILIGSEQLHPHDFIEFDGYVRTVKRVTPNKNN